MTEFLQSSF